ncbi:MAG: molybdopterin-guanine dinucleotide biosynthesis protein B [Hyphomicrobiales bacterium]
MTPPLFGVAGWKNSGKTTLMSRLIEEFARRGYRVAALKHAHHAFDIDHEGRDSFRFRQAGARQVGIVSGKRWAMMQENHDDPEIDFADMTRKFEGNDLLLVEGYKSQPFPKIEARSARTLTRDPLAKDDPTVVAVASDMETDAGGLPLFALDDIAAIADFIEAHLGLKRR